MEGPAATGAGAALVLRGTADGLVGTGEIWTQDSPFIEDHAETDDGFGWEIAVADHDNDGYADLLIGAVGEDGAQPFDEEMGVIHVLRGTDLGPVGPGAEFWFIGGPGMPGDPELFDRLGWEIA